MPRRPNACLNVLMVLCFLAALLSYPPVSAGEGIIKATVKKKDVETVPPQEQTAAEQPTIVIDTTTFDAGEVYEGDMVTHTFKVKNTGTAVLNIKNVKPG